MAKPVNLKRRTGKRASHTVILIIGEGQTEGESLYRFTPSYGYAETSIDKTDT